MRTQLFDRIGDVPKETWNGLVAGASATFSHEFWAVIERSGLNDFSYRYVLFFDQHDHPVALACYYSVTTDIAIFAPKRLRGLLDKFRRIFPNFLKLRMLECGTPIILNSPGFVVAPGVTPRELVEELHELLHRTAKAEGQFLIVVRDFEPNVDDLHCEFTRLGYHWVDSLPNTYLDIRWSSLDEYLASMKSYYRSKLLKHLKRNREQQIRHELVDDFSDLAETLCRQWLVVHEQADEFQREVLTPEFYRHISRSPEVHAKVLLFYRGGELVGHALLMRDGDLLRWLYFGRNEACNDSLYIYVGHAVVETAIHLGAKRVEMGLTTYSIKQDLGAQVVPIRLALHSTSRLINPFVGRVYPLLNAPPTMQNRNIFKVVGEGSEPKSSASRRR